MDSTTVVDLELPSRSTCNRLFVDQYRSLMRRMDFLALVCSRPAEQDAHSQRCGFVAIGEHDANSAKVLDIRARENNKGAIRRQYLIFGQVVSRQLASSRPVFFARHIAVRVTDLSLAIEVTVLGFHRRQSLHKLHCVCHCPRA